MATRIGCDKLHYAIQTTEETAVAVPVYATPTPAPGVISVNINPNGALATLFADDGPWESASTLGNIEVAINKTELTTQNKAELLGHGVDELGGLVYGAADVPPWVAVAFRTLKSNGKYRYVWLYKGRFVDPEDNNTTKADTIEWQTDTINGQFVQLQHEFSFGNPVKKARPWKYEIDADNPDADAATINTWFDSVVLPAGSTENPGTGGDGP